MPFTVGMSWLRVASKGRVCDGIDKLLTFEVSKDGEFHGAVVGLLLPLRLVEVADVVAQNVAFGDAASSRFCKSGDLVR